MDSEKAATEENTTPPQTDMVTAIDKETLSMPGDHDSEDSSEALAQEEAPSAINLASEEPPSEKPIEPAGPSGQDYSVLTVTQKKLVVLTASLASLFSPMATAIYCEILSLWQNYEAHSHTNH